MAQTYPPGTCCYQDPSFWPQSRVGPQSLSTLANNASLGSTNSRKMVTCGDLGCRQARPLPRSSASIKSIDSTTPLRTHAVDSVEDLHSDAGIANNSQRYCVSSQDSGRTTLQANRQKHPMWPLTLSAPIALNEKTDMESLTALPCVAGPTQTRTKQQPPPNWIRRVWLHYFTAYRVLIGLAFIANLIVVAKWLAREIDQDRRVSKVLIAVSANLFVAVLNRQEDWINASFALIAKMPLSLPLWIRILAADFHHFGGLHIGAAISSLMWYIVYVVFNTMAMLDCLRANNMTAWLWIDIVTCYLFTLFLLAMCITAHPKLRARYHNSFEHTHRFAGWISLAILWLNTAIGPSAHPSSPPLAKSPALYLLVGTTALIILPWLRIHRVPIRHSHVSARELKITFPYANMPYTSTVRFSRAPLKEWHSFATIPSEDGFTASIIISKAGDWTSAIIENTPSTLWMRCPPTKNFLTCVPLFSSLLLVATGAGIGPMLSLLQSPSIASMCAAGHPVRVLWCVYDASAPHWAFVLDTIEAVDRYPRIFDSKQGRADVPFEVQEFVQKEGLEAVMVVSNKPLTEKVVRGCRGVGIPAYGAVFDS